MAGRQEIYTARRAASPPKGKRTGADRNTDRDTEKKTAKGTGKGKVQISINGSVVELNAVTDGEAIPTGTTVRVAAICGTDLKVERQN